jgi:plasmid stability protein
VANILVRNVPAATVEKLKERARRHRRSLQAEALAALQADVTHSGDAFVDELERLSGEGKLSFDLTAALLALREDRVR